MDFTFLKPCFSLTKEAYTVILCTYIILNNRKIEQQWRGSNIFLIKRGISNGTETERFTGAAGPVNLSESVP